MARLRLLWNAAQATGIKNEDQKWLVQIIGKMIDMDYDGASRALSFLLTSQGYRSLGIWEVSPSTVVDVKDLRTRGTGKYAKIFTENAIGQYVKPGQFQALDLLYFPHLPSNLKNITYIQAPIITGKDKR